MLRNKSKNCEGIIVTIFGIEIDMVTFTIRLSQEKLKRAIKSIKEILVNSSNSILYLDI